MDDGFVSAKNHARSPFDLLEHIHLACHLVHALEQVLRHHRLRRMPIWERRLDVRQGFADRGKVGAATRSDDTRVD